MKRKQVCLITMWEMGLMDKWVNEQLDKAGVPPVFNYLGRPTLRREIIADLETQNDCFHEHIFGMGEQGSDTNVAELRDRFIIEILGAGDDDFVLYEVCW